MGPALPPRGFYRADVAPLLAKISDGAFRHWHWLRAHGWRAPLSFASLSEADHAIARLRGISERSARTYRRDLETAGLLAITASSGSTHLVPIGGGGDSAEPEWHNSATIGKSVPQNPANFGKSVPTDLGGGVKDLSNSSCHLSNNNTNTDQDGVEKGGGVGGAAGIRQNWQHSASRSRDFSTIRG